MNTPTGVPVETAGPSGVEWRGRSWMARVVDGPCERPEEASMGRTHWRRPQNRRAGSRGGALRIAPDHPPTGGRRAGDQRRRRPHHPPEASGRLPVLLGREPGAGVQGTPDLPRLRLGIRAAGPLVAGARGGPGGAPPRGTEGRGTSPEGGFDP